MNVADYLLHDNSDESPALLTLAGTYDYRALRAAAKQVRCLLMSVGANKGDRVLLVGDNSFFWVASYLGMLKSGVVCVPLSGRMHEDDLCYIAETTDARIAFAESKYLGKACACRDLQLVTDRRPSSKMPPGTIALGEPRDYDAATDNSVDLAPDDLAALMFTSGSTGKPRGVMISHRNIEANTQSIIQYMDLTSRDRIMSVLPFHYCYGISLLHTHLRVGGSIVIDPRFMYPDTVLRRMCDTHCTGFAGVPSHFQILLRRSILAKIELPDLRYVQQAGGQLAPAFILELQKTLPGKQIYIMYGQTEATARLSYLPPELLLKKVGSVGKGIPGIRLTVLDEFGKEVQPGGIGEVVAEGENVGRGYWRDEEATARCFRKGKLYTGDMATVDADGFIYIVDRAKDFLKCGGQRVSCRQLENVLLENQQLLEAAVVGMPDDILGEAAVAYIVPRNSQCSITNEQLSRHCRERLPLPLIPKHFIFVSSLPKNSSGKVLKAALKSHPLSGAAD